MRKQLGAAGFVHVRGSANGRDERPGPTERITPGYATLDLGGGWNMTRALELRMVARNTLDQEYLAGADTRTVPAPGRPLLLTVVLAIPHP